MAYLINAKMVAETPDYIDYEIEGSGWDLAPSQATIRIGKSPYKVDPVNNKGEDWTVETLSHEGPHWERLIDKMLVRLAKYWYSGDYPKHLQHAA